MAFRFLHLGDLHLETAFGGRDETRGRLARAVWEAFDHAIQCAIEREVHAVLIAGDAFDHDKFSLRGEQRFLQSLQRLVDRGIHVFYVTGNHDPGLAGGKAAGLGFQDAPEEVGPTAGLWMVRKTTPKATQVLDAAGQPVGFVIGAGHQQPNETTNLAAKFKRPETDLPVVGLLHTQVAAARVSGEHQPYAPSGREDYAQAELDYWALGHVHVQQRVFEDLPVWYCGNLQGRNPKESGPKGGLLVEMDPGEDPRVESLSFAPVLWLQEAVDDLAAASTREGLLQHLAGHLRESALKAHWDLQELCVRLFVSGPCPLASLLWNAEERERIEFELQGEADCLEVQIRPRGLHRPRDLTELENTPCVQREALHLLRDLAENDERLLELAPADLPGADANECASPEERLAYLRDRLDGLEEELLRRAFHEETWQ